MWALAPAGIPAQETTTGLKPSSPQSQRGPERAALLRYLELQRCDLANLELAMPLEHACHDGDISACTPVSQAWKSGALAPR